MANRFRCSVTARGGREHMNLFASVLDGAFPQRRGYKPVSPADEGMILIAGEAWCRPDEVEAAAARLRSHIGDTSRHFETDNVPFRKVWTLSRYLPAGDFTIEYRQLENQGCESGNPLVGRALFRGGELEWHETGVSKISQHEQQGPLDRNFIRDVAEEVLKNAYSELLSEVGVGFYLNWREKMSVNLDFEAFNYLKSLLDPIDQEILTAVEESFRVRLKWVRRRNEAANLAQAIGAFIRPKSDTVGACTGLDDNAEQHLVVAEQLLQKIAGGVPATY